MKRYSTVMAIFLLVGGIAWGQGTKEPFDTRKSKEELEIMRGILSTTFKFISQKLPGGPIRAPFSNFTAFYLPGQGAVFVIQTPGAQGFAAVERAQLDAAKAQLEATRWQLDTQRIFARAAGIGQGVGAGVGQGVGTGVGPGATPALPAPSAAPAPPARAEIDREELRKTVEEAQAKLKKRQEEEESNREKFLQYLAEVKTHLTEALANYGDSMTTVKPEEYVSLVLVTDDRQMTRSDVISARKSWIMDYKAGRINLEAFKQKVILIGD